MRKLASPTPATAVAGVATPRGPEAPDFEADVASHRPYLLRVAMVQLRDRDLAEDVVQETLMAAYGGLERFARRSTVKTWLTGILKNKVLDALRRGRREPVDGGQLQAEMSLGDIDEFFDRSEARVWEIAPESWRDPAASWEEKAFFDMVDFCLRRLPPSTARVFTMRELFEMEAHEICRELSITESNLRVLMYRARMALRQCLESNWFAAPSRG